MTDRHQDPAFQLTHENPGDKQMTTSTTKSAITKAQFVASSGQTDLRADDALKYAAAKARQIGTWAIEVVQSIPCATAEVGEIPFQCEHADTVDAIEENMKLVELLAARIGNPDRYSDGRSVTSEVQIDSEPTVFQVYIWHPEPSSERPMEWSEPGRGFGPGAQESTMLVFSTDPMTQTFEVEVWRRVE